MLEQPAPQASTTTAPAHNAFPPPVINIRNLAYAPLGPPISFADCTLSGAEFGRALFTFSLFEIGV
jgi:hypothetical protein